MRPRDMTQSAISEDSSMSSEITLMRGTTDNVTLTSGSFDGREKTGNMSNIQIGEEGRISTGSTKRGNKGMTYSDSDGMTTVSNEPLNDIRSTVKEFMESASNQLQQMTKSLDEHQKTVRNRVDELQKANDDARKNVDAKLDIIEQRIAQLDEKRIQSRTNHNELKRRFECFENRNNKGYSK